MAAFFAARLAFALRLAAALFSGAVGATYPGSVQHILEISLLLVPLREVLWFLLTSLFLAQV